MALVDSVRALFPFIPEALVQEFATAWSDSGDPQIALSEVRQSSTYEQFFPGNKRPDGSVRLTEGEYLSTVEGYTQDLERLGGGLSGAVLTPERKKALIEGDVSVQEFGSRVSTIFTEVTSRGDELREAFGQIVGISDLSDAALFASAVDPDRSPVEFQRELQATQVLAEGTRAGFNLTNQQAFGFQGLGLDQNSSRQFFQQASELLPNLQTLQARFNDPSDPLTLEDLGEALVIRDPDEFGQVTRLLGQSRSSFAGSAAAGGRDFTGLRQQ